MALLTECETPYLSSGYKHRPPPGVKQSVRPFGLTASNAVKTGTQTKSYCQVPILHSVGEEHEVV